MENHNLRDAIKLYIYYILIGAISALSLIVFPIIGAAGTDMSEAIGTAFPDSKIGWIIWTVTRCLIIILNMIIFSLFVYQSKINVKEEPAFKEAMQILSKHKPKEYRPKSPQKYFAKTYSTKGVTLMLTTAASLFAIGSAVINYDLMLLIATIFTIIISIAFGIITMKKCEVYYVSEFLDYAKEIERNSSKIKKEDIEECLKSMEKFLEISKNK